MPELPEVEIARRNLIRWMTGHVVVDVRMAPSRLLASAPQVFVRRLRGRRLEYVQRRGKHLLMVFDADVGLLSHLGMDGKWLLRSDGELPLRSRAAIGLDDGRSVHYTSSRLLGRLMVGEVSGLKARKEFSLLGPDPLTDGLHDNYLASICAGRRAPIKSVLMNQSLIAGLGNIQAAEALWLARIHPARPAGQLSSQEIGRLRRAIMRSIEATIAASEAEEIDYLTDGGGRENPFRVYGREGESCARCRKGIERIKLSGRGTFFCPECQADTPPTA